MHPSRYSALPLLGLVCAIWPILAVADIYKYVDAEGSVTFTDRYRPGAVRVMSDFAPSRGHATSRKPSAKSTPSPSHFPKVTVRTQRQRDDLRQQILLDEHGHETRLLAEARSELAAGARKPGADMMKLREAVRRHEENIAMLDKELARFK